MLAMSDPWKTQAFRGSSRQTLDKMYYFVQYHGLEQAPQLSPGGFVSFACFVTGQGDSDSDALNY